MADSLELVLANIHNWFDTDRIAGQYVVKDGALSLPFALDGQYVRIVGSVFNDGLHRCPLEGLQDESFEGEVWTLAIPQAVQDIAEEVTAYRSSNPATGYTSESFGGYSYSKATDDNGAPLTWQAAFRSALNPWRKLG